MFIFDININEFIKFFTLHLCTYIIYIKLINFKNITLFNKIIVVLSSIVLSFAYTIISIRVDVIVAFSISLLLSSLVIKYFIRRTKLLSVVSVYVLSFAVGYLLLIISSTIIASISMILSLNPTTDNNVYEYLSTDVLLIAFSFLLFKIKKFKNGLYFLQKDNKIENISVFAITIAIIFIYSYYLSRQAGTYDDVSLILYSLISVLVIGVCMYIWIRKSLDIQYKINLRDRNNKSLFEELENAKSENKKLLKDSHNQGKINHELNHKIKVLNNVVVDLASSSSMIKKLKEKYGADFDDIVSEVNETTERLILKRAKSNDFLKLKIFKLIVLLISYKWKQLKTTSLLS